MLSNSQSERIESGKVAAAFKQASQVAMLAYSLTSFADVGFSPALRAEALSNTGHTQKGAQHSLVASDNATKPFISLNIAAVKEANMEFASRVGKQEYKNRQSELYIPLAKIIIEAERAGTITPEEWKTLPSWKYTVPEVYRKIILTIAYLKQLDPHFQNLPSPLCEILTDGALSIYPKVTNLNHLNDNRQKQEKWEIKAEIKEKLEICGMLAAALAMYGFVVALVYKRAKGEIVVTDNRSTATDEFNDFDNFNKPSPVVGWTPPKEPEIFGRIAPTAMERLSGRADSEI